MHDDNHKNFLVPAIALAFPSGFFITLTTFIHFIQTPQLSFKRGIFTLALFLVISFICLLFFFSILPYLSAIIRGLSRITKFLSIIIYVLVILIIYFLLPHLRFKRVYFLIPSHTLEIIAISKESQIEPVELGWFKADTVEINLTGSFIRQNWEVQGNRLVFTGGDQGALNWKGRIEGATTLLFYNASTDSLKVFWDGQEINGQISTEGLVYNNDFGVDRTNRVVSEIITVFGFIFAINAILLFLIFINLKIFSLNMRLKNTKVAIYLGLFLSSCAALALEVTLTRLLSVITWYHLAFFAISTAMLGMTAGSVTVYLKPNWFSERNQLGTLAKASLGSAAFTLFSLIMLLLIPITVSDTVMSQIALLMTTFFCFLPFYFSGIVISGILTQTTLPIGRLYASDLAGAAIGCLVVLLGLEVVSAPSLIIFCGVISALAAFLYSGASLSKSLTYLSQGVILFLIFMALYNSWPDRSPLSPVVVKGRIENPLNYVYEKWNSFSRVVVYQATQSLPQLWSPSPTMPQNELATQYMLNIDGEAATVIRKYNTLDDIAHLRYDATNIAYYLLPPEDAVCIIGVGGGKDIQSAIYFGHKQIIGIDVNPIFIDLLNGPFREFAGIADQDGVKLVVDEARSYLTNTDEQFGVIQMSLIDTWAATGAGAYSLSENSLYTVEAWRVFMKRLGEDGIFSVSRWYSTNDLGETGRIVSLAVATLLEEGVETPANHIAMVTSGKVSTLLMSKKPFSNERIAKLKAVSENMQFRIEIIPGSSPENELLRNLISAKSMNQLVRNANHPRYNYLPPTDESPYFFNMLRLESLGTAFDPTPGVIYGNATATLTLVRLIIALAVMTFGAIILPLAYKTYLTKKEKKEIGIHWSGAVYFSLIGAGFMLLEIGLIQRFSVFLSHPIYALGILLFTIIASSGLGSFLSEKLPLNRAPWAFLFPLGMGGLILLMRFVLPIILSKFITAPLLNKIVLSILIIAPMGTVMGFFFPTGMRMIRILSNADTPWYWALNGIFGVLCSALAVFISIFVGISTNFYIAAILYSAVLIPIYDFYCKKAVL